MRFHDLRHTFATMTISNGVDVNEAPLSSKLGYFSAGFALDSYTHTHTTNDMQIGATEKLRLHGSI